MPKKIAIVLILGILAGGSAYGDDLYRVIVRSQSDAAVLQAAGVDPVVRLNRGYLVLADVGAISSLEAADLELELIASDVSRDQLAVDSRTDRENVDRFNLLFEEGNFRLFLLDSQPDLKLVDRPELFSVGTSKPVIEYTPSAPAPSAASAEFGDLLTLIGMPPETGLPRSSHRLGTTRSFLTASPPTSLFLTPRVST